ncbi:TetR family transcriptional regulator [Luteimicrobium sp. DT211]|uniref:TetR family transcriptional regulator n=1 Tax=Luteimicrobium sp. DT211 TaxID=3393412 RepID=UPI003CFB0683
MPRSGADARDRLERAALELYGERGYDQTTAADIAARAGLTARTFFRHFADKREVLFNVESGLRDELAEAMAVVPDSEPPLAAVLQAFRSMAPGLEEGRRIAEARHRVIAQNPALRERELAKAAAMSVVVAEGLRARGVPDARASLLAEVGTAAVGHAIHAWTAEPSSDLDALLVEAFDVLGVGASATLPSAREGVRTVLARAYVDDLDAALPLYRELSGGAEPHRFGFRGVRLARVGLFLLVEGADEEIRSRIATVLVDDVDAVARVVASRGGELLDGPAPGPNGPRLVARHPDGNVVEYIQPG